MAPPSFIIKKKVCFRYLVLYGFMPDLVPKLDVEKWQLEADIWYILIYSSYSRHVTQSISQCHVTAGNVPFWLITSEDWFLLWITILAIIVLQFELLFCTRMMSPVSCARSTMMLCLLKLTKHRVI